MIARELGGLYLWGEQLIVHSAHQYDTSLEHFTRLFSYIEMNDELNGQLKKKPTWTHGMEGFTLKSGARMRFRTRTRGGGRGFSGDCIVFDEDMFLPQFAHGALLPIVSAMPNPQLWYAGSAVDQEIHEHGLVAADLRSRSRSGDKSLAYFEWSLPFDNPAAIPDDVAAEPASWGIANPALGIRITEDYVAKEMDALDHRTFAVERLGVGDWPDPELAGGAVIPLEKWDALLDPDSKLADPIAITFDVSPDRSASIAAAGQRSDGLYHVEIVRSRKGTSWVVDELLSLMRHNPAVIACDAYGPVMSVARDAKARGVPVREVTTAEHGQACGLIVDLVDSEGMRHLGSDEIRRALKGAKTRPLGDAWLWSRKNSSVDISPLVAATLGLFVASEIQSEVFAAAW